MTIIEPNKGKERTFPMFILGVVLLIGAMAVSVLFYNQTVNLNYALKRSNELYKEELVRNAELKNMRYKIADTKELHRVAKQLGLVRIRAPQYIEVRSEPLASR